MLSEISPKLKKHSRVKVNAHAVGVGFYSYMNATVFGDTSESVDEVLVRVFLLSLFIFYGLTKNEMNPSDSLKQI